MAELSPACLGEKAWPGLFLPGHGLRRGVCFARFLVRVGGPNLPQYRAHIFDVLLHQVLGRGTAAVIGLYERTMRHLTGDYALSAANLSSFLILCICNPKGSQSIHLTAIWLAAPLDRIDCVTRSTWSRNAIGNY